MTLLSHNLSPFLGPSWKYFLQENLKVNGYETVQSGRKDEKKKYVLEIRDTLLHVI